MNYWDKFTNMAPAQRAQILNAVRHPAPAELKAKVMESFQSMTVNFPDGYRLRRWYWKHAGKILISISVLTVIGLLLLYTKYSTNSPAAQKPDDRPAPAASLPASSAPAAVQDRAEEKQALEQKYYSVEAKRLLNGEEMRVHYTGTIESRSSDQLVIITRQGSRIVMRQSDVISVQEIR